MLAALLSNTGNCIFCHFSTRLSIGPMRIRCQMRLSVWQLLLLWRRWNDKTGNCQIHINLLHLSFESLDHEIDVNIECVILAAQNWQEPKHLALIVNLKCHFDAWSLLNLTLLTGRLKNWSFWATVFWTLVVVQICWAMYIIKVSQENCGFDSSFILTSATCDCQIHRQFIHSSCQHWTPFLTGLSTLS